MSIKKEPSNLPIKPDPNKYPKVERIKENLHLNLKLNKNRLSKSFYTDIQDKIKHLDILNSLLDQIATQTDIPIYDSFKTVYNFNTADLYKVKSLINSSDKIFINKFIIDADYNRKITYLKLDVILYKKVNISYEEALSQYEFKMEDINISISYYKKQLEYYKCKLIELGVEDL